MNTLFNKVLGENEKCVFIFTQKPKPLFGQPNIKNEKVWGASLVAQWLRVCLPMQGTGVRALVWEDPTCRGATRPVSHNY